ncbi:MAG: hypothetical protein FI719_04455 [SAR202 cluster bacterium]|nr:hypothetical protein [SAR202 cluster bacterium]|tara:strand:+ start:51 stop:524 length:474 start_codon:yes stop_codon:yes gene_type:complete
MTQLSKNQSFESINVGDELPPFEIGETQETMDVPSEHSRIPQVRGMKPHEERKNLHNDVDFAKKSLFGTTANAGVMTMAYVNQMIEACFPAESFYNGGTLTYKGINPFRAGDEVIFTGEVVGKRSEKGKNFVDFAIEGIDKTGRLVGVAEVTIVPDA